MGTDLLILGNQGRLKMLLRRITPLILGVIFLLGLLWTPTQQTAAAPDLILTPVTWNVLGLDGADDPRGPNTFLVGARVCNEGDTAATNLNAAFSWANENPYINLTGPGTRQISSLGADTCSDFYFTIVITRDSAAYGTSRRYSITVSADGIPPLTTPAGREIYVERLTQSNSLTTTSITGPESVVVGNTYQYVVTSSTSTGSFEELVHSLSFPATALRIRGVSATYTTPADATNDKLHADACGWQNDLTAPNYRSCVGPPNYQGGVVGGTIVTTYTVEFLSPGTLTLNHLLYGYSGGDYLYNADYADDSLSVTSILPTVGISLPIIEVEPVTPTVTGTPPTLTPTPATPTPTFTGTILPIPAATKVASTTQVSIGQNLTFTISIRNNGSAPAQNVSLTDNFSAYTYLDIANLTTTKGTRNISGRIALVNIGTLDPNELVTVTIQLRVNSTAVGTLNPCNVAVIAYTGGSRNSNQICFRVVGGSTLPGTGELPLETPATWMSSPLFIALIAISVIFVLIVIFVVFRKSYPNRGKGWYWVVGFLLTCLGLLAVVLSMSKAPSPDLDIQLVSLESTEAAQASELTPAPTETINPLMTLPAYLFAKPDIIETLPSYPIPSPTIDPTLDGEEIPDTSPVVRIVIPGLNVDAKVAYVPFDGNTWLIQGLREEVAWMGDTSWPGLGGNTGLAGHITVRGLGAGPFRYLGDLLQNEVVYLYTEENIYTYSVREKLVVDETDLSVVAPTTNAQITLITCLDWDETLEIYLKRVAVTANLVKVERLLFTQSN